MLKRLELLGFKSFADKTAFEFGAGITCVVGPNGSGKSNVVDAIRWVLGEQSAKSLRGQEMADVIFNGSATRRSIGLAEASIVFDNRRRLLPVDADEVQITRRVYRSGDGEYLINKQPARLRDFRDLLMGTGAGTEAYSVIEQGKVDVLLQASTKDRRALFEEAAGISRFKARKLEALRKLEHVAANLLRVHDIIQEVEKQLRSVKLQAAKARRYQEYSERLRELRVRLALADYHAIKVQLEAIESDIAALGQEVTGQSTRCDSVDAKLIQVESLTEELDNQIRSQEAALTDGRQEIARLESQIAYERATARDVVAQLDRMRNQSKEFSSRVAELERHIATIGEEVARVDSQCAAGRAEVEAETAAVDQLRARIDATREQIEHARAQFIDGLQTTSRLRNELAARESQEKTLAAQRQRLIDRSTALAGPLQELAARVRDLTDQEAASERARAESRADLIRLNGEADRLRAVNQEVAGRIAVLREQRSALAARIELLDDLERRQEGLGTGVQAALALPELAGNVVGIVADLLAVDIEHAPWIERALGERAQHIVVGQQARIADALSQLPTRPQGVVSFLALDHLPSNIKHSDPAPIGAASPTADSRQPTADSNEPPMHAAPRSGAPTPELADPLDLLASQPGFIARADTLVRTADGHGKLAAHLLGRTVIVRDLSAALAMASGTGHGGRFVTTAGDILEPDGTITTGDAHTQAGLVSRKSQLRALRDEIQSVDSQVAALDLELQDHAGDLDRLRHALEQTELRLGAANDAVAEFRNQLGRHHQQLAAVEEDLRLNQSESAAIDRELSESAGQRDALAEQLVEADRQAKDHERFIHDQEASIQREAEEVDTRQNELTTARVALAKTEGQLAGLRQRVTALTADLEDRRRVQSETGAQIAAAVERERTCTRKVLAASSQIAELYLRKEKLSREIVVLLNRREGYREQRQALSAESQAARERLQTVQSQLHQRELEAGELRHQAKSLVERMREDYELDLAGLYQRQQPVGQAASLPPEAEEPSESPSHTPPETPLDREAAGQEIQELRRKIAALGNVNLEALSELQELETRATTLHAQLNDLNQSKATLDEIIRKINADSQRLFVETLEAIRGHFGELFRKLFGGGRADIVLEDEADVLESGIEIVARPPGKELRTLSLLSGGEKTLTAVALLLAVFRSKPSPFCILDEVDAALDEANIDRFITVLRDFAAESQFIMITHSKKSMICTDVLYGVTMQESGVSKRVSVRLEDVGERGEISQAALQREDSVEPEAA